ncbi:hypothetical protein [Bradyrhizobium sp. ARR65]|uniref:hypothetical protein n=1 Tax=Bradyrhizobium sp. ARR65 TaxID=1040989 RepID=UPI0004648188|nr:hypothetical protein [Bradyrhizobium sp. ARR65]
MTLILKVILFILAASGAIATGYVFYIAALSPNDWVYQGGSPANWKNGGVHGAPGPIVGTGLPVIGVAYGVYWLVKRRRKPD